MFKGIFGDMFDMNRDGKLDALERAAEAAFLDELEEDEFDDEYDDDWDDDWDE